MKKLISAVILAALVLSCKPSGHVRDDAYFRNRAVKLIGNNHACSGEQITAPSGKTYILTASHCKELSTDGVMHVIREDKKEFDVKVIAEDPTSDLLLLQGLPHLDGLEIAKDEVLHSHVRTYTHGLGLDTHKSEGEIFQYKEIEAALGEVGDEASGACDQPKNAIEIGMFGEAICCLKTTDMTTTAFISPGSSGGMVVDDRGALVGVVSAGGQGFGFLVTLKDIKNFLHKR